MTTGRDIVIDGDWDEYFGLLLAFIGDLGHQGSP